MLSILIPTYNYNVFNLAETIVQQALKLGIVFELICIDDGSLSKLNIINNKINSLTDCKFIENDKNIGRSAIRNQLAEKAKYEFLLFLDADVKIISNDFILNYLKVIAWNTQIIYGGILYQKETPNTNELLRWVYGKKREALSLKQRQKKPHLSFSTLNFVIRKSLFNDLQFNEEIPNLRNEDLIFAMDAKRKNILVEHINNPVIHLGIENSQIFLAKTIETLHSFSLITNNGILNPNDALITRVALKIEKLKLDFIFKFLFKKLNLYFKKNLLSKHPSLFIFDLFRLCYFLQIKN